MNKVRLQPIRLGYIWISHYKFAHRHESLEVVLVLLLVLAVMDASLRIASYLRT